MTNKPKPTSRPGNSKGIPQLQQPDTELIGQFLENQSKELALKSQELVLKQQADHHSFEYAKKALDSQLRDRDAERAHRISSQKNTLRFALAIFATGAFFLGFVIYNGKDAIAMEIVKATIFLISGGSGGYAIGKTRKNSKKQQPSDDDPDEAD